MALESTDYSRAARHLGCIQGKGAVGAREGSLGSSEENLTFIPALT